MMINPVRQEILATAQTVVVKVGTNVLTSDDGRLDPQRLQSLADQIHRIRQSGRKVALVSSGAIGAGIGRLGLGRHDASVSRPPGTCGESLVRGAPEVTRMGESCANPSP